MVEPIGDAPIEPEYQAKMNAIAEGLDKIFNGAAHGEEPQTGFVLLIFPFWDHWGRCNYISNADPADILTMLRGQVKRLEERTGKDHD